MLTYFFSKNIESPETYTFTDGVYKEFIHNSEDASMTTADKNQKTMKEVRGESSE